MTDPRPICPIPPDAQVGDIVVLRDGERCVIDRIDHADKHLPYRAGRWWMGHDGVPGIAASLKAVAFKYADGRKPNLPNTEKPKRTQAQNDAEYIRHVLRVVEKCEKAGLAVHISQQKIKRMLAIADRLGEQK